MLVQVDLYMDREQWVWCEMPVEATAVIDLPCVPRIGETIQAMNWEFTVERVVYKRDGDAWRVRVFASDEEPCGPPDRNEKEIRRLIDGANRDGFRVLNESWLIREWTRLGQEVHSVNSPRVS